MGSEAARWGWLREDSSVPLRVLQPYCVSLDWCPKVCCPLCARNKSACSPETILSQPASASRLLPAGQSASQPASRLSALGVPCPAGGGRAPHEARARRLVLSRPASPSLGVPRPRRPHAPSSVHAACRGWCGSRTPGRDRPTRRQHGGPRRPRGLAASRVPAAEGDGEGGETRGVGDRHSLGEHSYGWRQTAAGGGTLPPSGDGRRDTSPGGCSTVSLLPPSSRRLRAGPGGTGRRLRLALPAPRAAAAGRGSPASRGGAAAAAARQAASLWESERGAGSAGEARG